MQYEEFIEKEEKQEIVDAIKEGQLYDYICSYSYRIEETTLIELLLECIAIVDSEKKQEELIENLKEYKSWEVE